MFKSKPRFVRCPFGGRCPEVCDGPKGCQLWVWIGIPDDINDQKEVLKGRCAFVWIAGSLAMGPISKKAKKKAV